MPYPYAAEDHQSANAARLQAAGAAVVVEDGALQAGALPALLALTVEPQNLAALAQGASRLTGPDPLNAILARIDALLSRKSQP